MSDDFLRWNKEVAVQITLLHNPKKRFPTNFVVDCAVPFKLGWSPERTARALLKFDKADYSTLRQTAAQEEKV